MENQEISPDILKKYGIIFDSQQKLSQFGGLASFIAYLKKGEFRERLEREFGPFKGRSLMQFILGLIAGAKTMKEIADAAKDPLIKSFLENPVEEAQLGRDFRKFDRQEIESLHEFNIAHSIYDFIDQIDHDEVLFFDIDATPKIKYGHQEGVERGYVGQVHPEKCYQYLFIRLENRNTFLHGTIRSGSTHSQNDFCGYLDRFLPMLKKRWQNIWRGDSGYFNEAAFDRFSEHDATFYIKAPMSSSRLNLAQTSPDLVWSKEERGISYAQRVTETANSTKYIEVFKRSRIQKEQMSLMDIASYRYDCVATNDFSSDDEQIFKNYNKRANIENNIKELKYDYHLGQIVTDSFDANDVITQATLLAYLLMQHFKNELLPKDMQKCRLSTVRHKLFLTPGRILNHARQSFLRIQNVFCSENVYQWVYKKIDELKTLLIAPPDLSAG